MKFEILRNDITSMQVDAIVLPANSYLKEGSGTSAAIFEKAGREELRKACKRYKKVDVGNAVATLGYGLDTEYIVHTVVPKWKNGKHHEYELLSSAYLSALTLADTMHCKSLAFPLLASGNNGFDKKVAFRIATESIDLFEANHELEKVYLVVYDIESVVLLADMGITVEELIDTKYVLSKDESGGSKEQKLLEEGKAVGNLIYEDALVAMTKALKRLEDPELRNEIYEKAFHIGKNCLDGITKDDSKADEGEK